MLIVSDEGLKLSELRTLLVTESAVCSEWEGVGMAVGLADEDDGQYLDTLPQSFPQDDKKCFLEVLKKWLRASKEKDRAVKPATWRHLLRALKDLNLDDVVKKVEQHFGRSVYLLGTLFTSVFCGI